MGAFKLQTLKQKLWAIVAASFVTRVILFFALPNTPSSLAPDEGIYAAITKWLSDSKLAKDFPNFGEGLYLSGRSLIVPSVLLTRLGINELDAVRLIATLFGVLSLILVVLIILKLDKKETSFGVQNRYNTNLITGIVFIFAFLPSHFIWSNLGLRESVTEFGLIATFVSFFYIFHHHEKILVPTTIYLFASIVVTFSARPQVGWVLSVSLMIFLLISSKNNVALLLIPVVLCGALLGSFMNSGNTGMKLLNPLLESGEVVSSKQVLNQVGAVSVIKTLGCPFENESAGSEFSNKFDTYLCLAWRAPYMVSTFLLRPIIGVDVTSASSLLAAIENIFWLALFMAIIFLMIRKRTISFLNPILPSLIFFMLYVLGASAYQGNMGTAFRHKSLVLWVVLLVIFALLWRKPEDFSKKPRNNSQESAV
jgi:hypothetical protein